MLRATWTAGGLRPECLACGAAINVGRPYPRLVGAISVFSNVQVTPEQLAWLMDQFKAQRQTYGDGWTIELGKRCGRVQARQAPYHWDTEAFRRSELRLI